MSGENYLKTLTSFSGADLIVNFGSRVIGELQSISWGIQREKAPVYTLGSPDPRSFSRGKRGIAGSMVFAVFDRDALREELLNAEAWNKITPLGVFSAKGNIIPDRSLSMSSAIEMSAWNTASNTAAAAGVAAVATGEPGSKYVDVTDTTQGFESIHIPPGFGVITPGNLIYIDTIPPFDVTMTFANEYGQCAFQKIYDIDVLNEGSGVSVDTIVMERKVTYIARRVSGVIHGIDTGAALQGIEVKI